AKSSPMSLPSPRSIVHDTLDTFAFATVPSAQGASPYSIPTRRSSHPDLDAGSITNTATASGNGATSAPASATVTATQTKALSLANRARQVLSLDEIQIITYTHAITNDDNVSPDGRDLKTIHQINSVAC